MGEEGEYFSTGVPPNSQLCILQWKKSFQIYTFKRVITILTLCELPIHSSEMYAPDIHGFYVSCVVVWNLCQYEGNYRCDLYSGDKPYFE